MYSIVDMGKCQYAKSKFKVHHKISVLLGHFAYILEVVGYNPATSSYMYSVISMVKVSV